MHTKLYPEPFWRVGLDACAILASDLKHEIRALRSMPGFAAIVLFVMALGIGSTVSIFSVVNAVLLRSLPYGDPANPNANFKGRPEEMGPSVPDFYAWQRLNHTFSSMAAFTSSSLSFVQSGSAQSVSAAFVTANFFQTLNAKPTFGRVIDANDDQSGHELVAREIRAALRSLDPALTLDIKTMQQRIVSSNARRTFQTSLLSGFAAIAIVLAVVGLYGLMSYTVKQRSNEIGIRLALGSSRSRIVSLIVSQGMRLTTYGLLTGLAGSFALTRLVSSWLYGVQAADPLTFILVPLFVLVVDCVACLIPAWSATRIDPIQTLRL